MNLMRNIRALSRFAFVFAICLFASNESQGQSMMYIAMPNGKVQFLDSSGKPLSGGLLYTYQSGASIPQVTFRDPTASEQNANPVVLDNSGRASIFLPN